MVMAVGVQSDTGRIVPGRVESRRLERYRPPTQAAQRIVLQAMTTRRRFQIVILIVAGFALASMIQLAASFAGPLDLPFQRVAISIELDPTVNGDTVRIEGTTNLPDGALVDYWLYRGFGLGKDGPTGAAEVRDGEFVIEHDMAGYEPGRWRMDASFSTVWGSSQPAAVTALVGSEGEHLAGPQVYVDSPGDEKQI